MCFYKLYVPVNVIRIEELSFWYFRFFVDLYPEMAMYKEVAQLDWDIYLNPSLGNLFFVT